MKIRDNKHRSLLVLIDTWWNVNKGMDVTEISWDGEF